MNEILQNYRKVSERIRRACENCGRRAQDVTLLLATKTVPPEKIRVALNDGASVIGENKVQELVSKYEALRDIPHQTHCIGHLQTNKIKEIVKYADCLQSLDRPELAVRLQKRLESEDKTLDVLLQVNTSRESSKFGIAPEHVIVFAKQVRQFDRLHIKGLMTIGLFAADIDKVRYCYRLLKILQEQLLDNGFAAHTLSMGMSNDLEAAIEEGATMVRVGTAVFGNRKYPDKYYWNEHQ